MPQKSQTVAVEGHDSTSLTAISYGAFELLGWAIKYAVENKIVGYAPGNWGKRHGNEITIEAGEEQLAVTSKMIHEEAFDMMGKNKKLINEFLAAFESVKKSKTEEHLNTWKEKIVMLQQETIAIAEEEAKQAAEVDKAMNLSGSNLYVTYSIIGINVVIFILMCVSGVDVMSPTGIDILKWGGNHAAFTLSGDWWRLITCVFVHIGIIHIVFNMYALYMVGIYLEPIMGKARFISAYLATGICASLVSLWWHTEPIASAGASGAIFGMYGVFLALLTTNLIPKLIRDQMLKSIAIFIGYNLIYGMRSGVDNSAHVGGLLSGLIIGYVFYLDWKGGNKEKKKMVLASSVLIVSVLLAYFYLENNKVGDFQREQMNYVIRESNYKDGQKFMEKIQAFSEIEERAMAPLTDSSLTEGERSKKLDSISLKEWDKAEALLNEMKTYDIDEIEKKKVNLLDEYIQLRKQEIGAIRKIFEEKSPENQSALTEVNNKIADLFERLKNL